MTSPTFPSYVQNLYDFLKENEGKLPSIEIEAVICTIRNKAKEERRSMHRCSEDAELQMGNETVFIIVCG